MPKEGLGFLTHSGEAALQRAYSSPGWLTTFTLTVVLPHEGMRRRRILIDAVQLEALRSQSREEKRRECGYNPVGFSIVAAQVRISNKLTRHCHHN